MGSILITRTESSFFVLSFLLLFVFRASSFVIFFAVALSTLFILKRKELYFFWSILAPRINGDAPILTNLHSLAKEEGPGNDELPDLLELNIPFLPPLVFIFKIPYIKRVLSLEADSFSSSGDQGPMVKIANSGNNILLSSGPPNPHWAKYREVTSVINKDRFGENSLVGQMFQQTWKTCQELSVTHFGPKVGRSFDLFKELYHVMIPAHNRALFGEEWARKFSYAELNEEVYDIITETGKQLKFDWCPPNVKGPYMAKLKRVNDAVRNMGKDSPSAFMKPLLDATKKGIFTEEELQSNLLIFEYAQLGGKPLLHQERIDEIKYNAQEVFTDWSARLFDAISANVQTSDKSSRELVLKNKLLGFQNFDFNVVQVPFKLAFTDKTLKKEAREHYQNNVIVAQVKANVLVNSEPTNQIFAIDLYYPSGSLYFHAGDNAIVMPSNPSDQVDKLVKRLGYNKEKVFEISGQEFNPVTDLSCSLGNNLCTLEIALSYYYDITSPPSASMLQFLAMHSTDDEDQKTILSYVSNYMSFLRLNLSILDLLETTPSIHLHEKEEALSVFLGLLGPIKQRHYSIANFPSSSPNILRIVYKVVTYKTRNGQEKHGLCSNYLKNKKEGDKVVVGVVKSKFRLPSDNSVPIMMIGAGSGISPYFGFVEERMHNKTESSPLGAAILLHGCRSESDFANLEKIEYAVKGGFISELWPAYSRKSGAPKMHIQDVVQNKGAEVWKLLEQGAIIYVCGDVAVGISVRDSLVKIAQEHGKFGAFKAHSWLLQLIKDGRLRNDEWGIATSSGVHAIRAARLKLWRKSIMAIFAFSKRQIN